MGPDFVTSNAQFPQPSRQGTGDDDYGASINDEGKNRAKNARDALANCYRAILSTFADAHLAAAESQANQSGTCSAGQTNSQSQTSIPQTLRFAPAAASAGQPGGGGGTLRSGGGGGNGGVGGLGGHTGVIGGAGASTVHLCTSRRVERNFKNSESRTSALFLRSSYSCLLFLDSCINISIQFSLLVFLFSLYDRCARRCLFYHCTR